MAIYTGGATVTNTEFTLGRTTILVGDCRAALRTLPAQSIHCAVTSPPYYGLRDYGVAGQLGLETSVDAYINAMVDVFREVWRVLRDDGTLWLNVGDSYSGSGKGPTGANGAVKHTERQGFHSPDRAPLRIPAKNLMLVPWRLLLALQAEGWVVRSIISWQKTSPMPESVTDRPTKSHEYLFLLAKSERYFYDAKAVSEQSAGRTDMGRMNFGARVNEGGAWKTERPDVKETRNRRSVWTVATTPYSGAHFATMPEKLVEPCILAGSRLGDIVLDPFIGSGTVGAVADRLGRKWVGLDLSPAYLDLGKRRTAQAGLPW